MTNLAVRILTILFFIIYILSIGISDVEAGNTCSYLSLNRYVCGAWDQCGTGASCGATCKTGVPGTVNCGGPNGCDYICKENGDNCLSNSRYIDFVPPNETRSWETWNGDIVDPYGARTNVDTTSKIPISYTSPDGKLTFIASASRNVGVSNVGLTGIVVKNTTTNQTYTDTSKVRRLPCSSIFNASNRYALGNLDGTSSQCRRYKDWIGCYYGMEDDYIGYSDSDKENACGWLANSGPPWLDEIKFQLDETDLAAGNNTFEVSILGGDGVGTCETKTFNYIYNPDNSPPTNPGDPMVAACIPIGGGIMPITFTGSSDSGSGLSHYVVNVDEGNNNTGNFPSRCNNSNNSGDVCVSINSTSFNYHFNDDLIYRIWIDAFDNSGNKSSSNAIVYSPKTIPPSPTSVSATDGLLSQVNVSWTDNSNSTYNSETRFDIVKDGIVIGFVSPNVTSYVDNNDVCDGTNHMYDVIAINSCGGNTSTAPNSGNCITLHENTWWQVFNGGVHSNFRVRIDDIPLIEALVGDSLSVDHPFIAGESISSFNSYGLVSSTTDSVSISNGKAGISGRNYFAAEMSGNMDNLASPAFFDRVMADGSAFRAEPSASLSSIGNSKSPVYFQRSSSDSINSIISYNENKVVAIIFSPSNSTLTIRKNIIDTSKDKDKFLIMFVDGNVSIESGVTELNSIIYASGNITIESKGTDLDDQLFIVGGLYGNNVLFKRDLKDIVANRNKPAEMILHNYQIIKNQDYMPKETKETPITWVLDY